MMDEYEEVQETDSYEDKESERVERRTSLLFKEVFDSDEGKEVLSIMSSLFDMHAPSMPASNFDTIKASYMDGQKSVLCEIKNIISGEYTKK